jgi:Uma2 family endonuclease
MQIAEKRMTIAEFEAFLEEHADDGNRYELYDGEILTMTGAKPGHNHVAGLLYAALLAFGELHNLGWAMYTPGVKPFPNQSSVYFPDAAFFSITQLQDPYTNDFIPFSPDIAIEVVSPGNLKEEIASKVLDYLDTGSRLVWVVYPQRRNVIIYRVNKTFDVVEDGQELSGEDVLPGFTYPLNKLFKKKD